MKFLNFLSPSYGKSIENAIVVRSTNTLHGVQAEYKILSRKHGKQGEGWELESRMSITHEGKPYDVFNIKLKSGKSLTYYFDISRFYGKLGF